MVDEASARAAFSTIYEKDGWDWGNITDAHQNAQRVAGLLQNILRDYEIRSMAEFGTGFWNYARLIDFTGVRYDGYDIVPGLAKWNTTLDGRENIVFHDLRDGELPAPADLVFTKDVLQHLPVADIRYYLAAFKQRFRYIVAVNDVLPDANTNGDIAHGGHRPLRLEHAPFGEKIEVLDEWDGHDFGRHWFKQAVLIRGDVA